MSLIVQKYGGTSVGNPERIGRRKLAKDDPALDYPKIEDGVRGMAFIEAVVKSSKANARWTKLAV